jgi:hypothetical protein
MRNETDDHCHKCVNGKCPWSVKQIPQPFVHSFGREHNGTYYGGKHDTELADVSIRKDIMKQEQQDEHYLCVKSAGFGASNHRNVELCHETMSAFVQYQRQCNRQHKKKELQYNPSHR